MNKRIVLLLMIIIFLATPSLVFANDNSTNNDTLKTDYGSYNSFSKLNDIINNNESSYIELHENYTYNPDVDSKFVNGITLNRSFNIVGYGITINGAGQSRIFNIASGDVFIRNINFINAKSFNGGAITGNGYGVIDCNFSNNVATQSGGAIYGGSATNCTFSDNHARDGGAIAYGSSMSSRFISNSARYGGALYRSYAENSLFISNHASDYSGAMEGGSALNCNFTNNSAESIYGAGSFYADNCIFINNTAKDIGGALCGNATNCKFISNRADQAGALSPVGAIINCLFENNHARVGGVIYSDGGSSVSNSRFINNSADEYGGALYGIYAVNCEFRDNSANIGGAIYDASALNCTFIGNSAKESSGAIHGSVDNCTFISNSAQNGGAIASGSARNSNFESNHAAFGGALYGISSQNCTFTYNQANQGGAIYGGSAVNCNFLYNNADYGGAIAGSCSAIGSKFIGNIAKVSGGACYESSFVNCYMEGNLPKYKLSVSDFEAIYGFGGEITIKLADSPYDDLKGIKTIIKIFDSDNNIIETGNCYSGYSYFVNLNVGKYTVEVSVDDERYDADSVNASIIIKKSTSIYVVGVTATYDINNPLIINLHDSSGVILKNAPVQITVNGVTKTYWTNNNGQVLFSTKGLVPNTYTASILYAGNDIYVKSSAIAKITVKKANPIIVANKPFFKLKVKIKKYSITLKNNLYKVMKNTKVTLKVNGKNYKGVTNSRGQALFKITKLNKRGRFKATVKYSGNNRYNPVSRNVIITVAY